MYFEARESALASRLEGTPSVGFEATGGADVFRREHLINRVVYISVVD